VSQGKKNVSIVFRWFGFPFGVGVMTEAASVKIKNCKEHKKATEACGRQMWKDRKRTSGEEEKKFKELRV
jgi:hypothetical protein